MTIRAEEGMKTDFSRWLQAAWETAG